MRDSFIFYRSFYEAIKELSDKETAECMRAICEYALDGKDIVVKGKTAKIVMALIKPQLSANNKRYENGSKGGRPKKETNGFAETETNGYSPEKPNENVNVNVNENVNEEKETSKERRFVPPTVEEVRDYCRARNNSIDPETFVDFYKTKGWKVGKSPMKDWQACVRTWEKSRREQKDTTVPVYDDSNNMTISRDELDDILKEMNRA